jgi:hypothetical protein
LGFAREGPITETPPTNLRPFIWDFLVLFDQLLNKPLNMKSKLFRLKCAMLILVISTFSIESYPQFNLNAPVPH